jgi:predicted ATPase
VIDPGLQTLKRLILEKTEGTPFFMEEVVQTLAEEGVLIGERGYYQITQHVTILHVPTTVQGILAARIDRLAVEEKAFLHQLAIIGRQFPLSLVRKVVSRPEEELYRLLSSLQSKEFLYEQPAFPEPVYIFKHALTQEVAYGTVLQDRRKGLHERTAQAIESLYSSKLEDHYSELAHHYSRSGNTEKAVEYLQLAGQQAVQRSANVEAISHLTAALELLKTLPDTPERAQQELTLQIALGVPLMVAKGYGSPEVGYAYERARELCRQAGETAQHFAALRGLVAFYYARAELPISRGLGEQLLQLAQRMKDPAFLLEAHGALGQTLHNLGEVAAAREHAEQVLALYNPQKHYSLAFLYGVDSGAMSLFYSAWALWLLGYPDQALKRVQDALALARELSHPFSLALMLDLTALIHQLRREGQAAQARAEAAIALCEEQGFRDLGLMGAVFWRWGLAEKSPDTEAIAQLHQSIDAYRATGAEAGRRYLLTLLAEGYGKVGQPEQGLQVVTEALETMDKTGERREEAELYRLKGELSLQSAVHSRQSEEDSLASSVQSLESAAEECFQKAIAIAQRQQAKSLELRATVSLARLWQQQGKQHEARDMLSAIYNWFTEGFDTKDLQEAKALLAQLEEDC